MTFNPQKRRIGGVHGTGVVSGMTHSSIRQSTMQGHLRGALAWAVFRADAARNNRQPS
ncbi:hypothetical protein [Acetobacter cibinongensis]|uniref:hypothetical protein n=1 Tax=Acetobacter cibinongensis TaxID=146475 RepID=UPI0013FD8B5B|nr:hypothetical protein [Acetobacter cibinongensis]